ncbi:SCO6745 family protein [Jatrophihabitans sp. YIM 134969]
MSVDADAPAPTTGGSTPRELVGRAHRALEPLHSQIYFAEDAAEVLVETGLRPGRMPYFASRAAPMGEVGPGTVTATFYNFNPDLVARFIPRAWTLASAETVLAARFRAAETSLRRVLGDDVAASDEVAELAALTTEAAAACTPEGRPLYAAHADLDPPDGPPHLVLWHAVTLLREHRGDGHLAALLRAELSGVEAIQTHTATGRGFTAEAAKKLRGWSDDQWSAATDRLRARGLLDADGGLTAEGVALRAQVEAETDALAAAPWEHLGAERTRRVIELAKPLARRVAASGVFGSGVFTAARA